MRLNASDGDLVPSAVSGSSVASEHARLEEECDGFANNAPQPPGTCVHDVYVKHDDGRLDFIRGGAKKPNSYASGRGPT